MAKYQISNIKIKPVGLITNPDGTTSIDLTKNPNKDRFYAVMDLINKAYAWDTPKIHTMFEPAFVEMLKPYVSKADGGTSDEGTKALPAHLECISGAFVEWIAPVPFYKRYLTDQDPIKPSPANPNGRRAMRAGEIVCTKDGKSNLIYDRLTVFCQFFIDPDTGEKVWVRGQDPSTLGMSSFANYCTPVKAEVDDEAGAINVERPAPDFTQGQQTQSSQSTGAGGNTSGANQGQNQGQNQNGWGGGAPA